jgi:formylglycine-generating enzyme required for sulfatase activity/energy-coupling factor transporter ATP-binding protein EcfA2
VAGRIQQWKDKNEREAAQEIAVEAAHNSALRDELDTVLEALNTIAVAQDALRKPDRKWLVETLREELTHLGNLPRFEAHLRGSGAIAQGRKAAAAGKRAVANTGEIRNSVVVTGDGNVVYSGSPTRDPAKALAIYRHVLINSYRHVSLRGLDIGASDPTGAPQRFDLTQVYVDVLTTTQVPVQRSAKRGRRPETDLEDQRDTRLLSVLEAVGQHRWAVVLGDPGSGKSTFLTHLALCLAAHEVEQKNNWLARLPGWPGDEVKLLPILVTLREFARWLPSQHRSAEPQHVWNFLVERLNAQNLHFVTEVLQDRLDRGEVLLLFDGLDEIPTQQQRAFIRDAVIAFANRYHRCRLIVTCRTLSYQDPVLRLTDAPDFTLAPFSDEQIDRFIAAWYGELARLGSLKPEMSVGMIQRLQDAVRRPDLRRLSSNPLLLGAMALVHTHKGQLPDARALLYEETIDILLWRWDQLKTNSEDETSRLRSLLTAAGRTDVDVKRALCQLAFVAHEKGGTGDGETVADIGELQLVKTLSALHPEGSRDWAYQVIDVMKLRAGLLLERAPEVYTFPHRTFQEYLAGAYLASQTDFAQQAGRLTAESALWREVILLAVGRLVYRDGDTAKPLTLVAELCPAQSDDTPAGWRRVWLAGDVLLEMGRNRATDSALGRDLVERVSHGLVALLRGSHLSTIERARAGDTLARLGDPRFSADAWYLPDEPLLGFVAIPDGPFLMGSNPKQDKQAGDREQPHHTVALPHYYIARYPVTVAQFRAFVEHSGHQPDDERSLQGLANHPVTFVTWHDALAYCRWLTERIQRGDGIPEAVAQQAQKEGWEVRLPSEAEWEKAARGSEGQIYPWGNDWREDHANTRETGMNSLSAVGSFPQGVSPYGCLDMAGNVWEWTRSCWGEVVSEPGFPYPYNPTDGRENLATSDNVLRVLRGGSSLDDARNARCAYRGRDDPDSVGDNGGFRVVVLQKL